MTELRCKTFKQPPKGGPLPRVPAVWQIWCEGEIVFSGTHVECVNILKIRSRTSL